MRLNVEEKVVLGLAVTTRLIEMGLSDPVVSAISDAISGELHRLDQLTPEEVTMIYSYLEEKRSSYSIPKSEIN